MAVCELPPLCSKSTPLKKKTKKQPPLLHVRSTPSQKSYPCCTSEVPPLLEKHPLSKKVTPVARRKYPLCSKSTPSQKKSTPSQKKRGNFGGFHLPYRSSVGPEYVCGCCARFMMNLINKFFLEHNIIAIIING